MKDDSATARRARDKALAQIKAKRVGFLLGAGSSFLGGTGFPLAFQLWDRIGPLIREAWIRDAVEEKFQLGATGLENALDMLDDGGAVPGPHRQAVTDAIANSFATIRPSLNAHKVFVGRLAARREVGLRLFSLNYDPLIERASDAAKVRLVDGFAGCEQPYFEPAVFQERTGIMRGAFTYRRFDETARPLRLIKLHGSMGWYEDVLDGVRRRPYSEPLPNGARRLMVPPQRRKAADTAMPPYSSLWSIFRGCLCHDSDPLNRLVSIGYGFADEHVNDVIEAALVRSDFTLVILTRALSDVAWARWSVRKNVVAITENRCCVNGEASGIGESLWDFACFAEAI